MVSKIYVIENGQGTLHSDPGRSTTTPKGSRNPESHILNHCKKTGYNEDGKHLARCLVQEEKDDSD